jgi:hypothetical protein
MNRQKVSRILYSVLFIYALLVATHLGEFWPFSIYPMFSQAGNEWSRSLVHEIPADYEPGDWSERMSDELPGDVFALNRVGINQNDLANLISKNEDWSDQRLQSIRRFFGDELQENGVVVYRVRGRFSDEGSHTVSIGHTPYIYFLPDTTIINPKLREP